jgi:phosphoenolpyruvate synthase/pyruvate phosphate dikinase
MVAVIEAAYVLSPPEASTATVQSVGAKAATLARLTAAGIPVPGFFVVASPAFALHLRQNRIPWPPASDEVTSWEGWSTIREHIRTSPLEATLSRQILDGYGRLGQDSGHGRVAVRSSGSEEDSQSASFAGQFNSTLNVEVPTLLETVKDCWASYVSEASLQYRATHQIPVGPVPSFGVIVQIQVFSQRAGVVFTVHPLEPTRQVVYIEANFGTGESVVGGIVTPDTATFSRSTADVVDRITGTKRRMTAVSRDSPGTRVVDVEEIQRRAAVLTDFEVREISQTGLRIEELMGRPQDVEWAYDAEQLWIVQARPITGLPASGF